MMRSKLRWLVLGTLASAGAGLLTLTSAMNSAFAFGDDTDIGLVMGGSGEPIPGSGYVEAANTLYIAPNFPETTYPGVLANGLVTPEAVWPGSALDPSVSQGVTILNNNIETNLAADDASTVFGYSQSTAIASLEMEALDPSGTPSADDVNFVLIGDLMNPNGGIFARFPGVDWPSLGITFYGATPADDFPTDIYTIEYDGFGDFPQYPIDFLADLNAGMGLLSLHGDYLSLTASQLESAILLPGSALDGATDSLTNYYMIDATPPLVSALGDIPVIGQPLEALLGPDLTVLINLGYGSLTQGYSTGPADVATPFGLWPTDISASDLLSALESGAQQGWTAFVDDLQNFSLSSVTSEASSSLPSMTDLLSTLASDPGALVTDIANTFSVIESNISAGLQTTANLADALFVSVPAYDFNLFVDDLEAGNLLDAVAMPIAADTAFATLLGGLEIDVLETTATTIANSLTSLIG